MSGQQTNNFEELHLLTPGISWSPDGKRVALATKAGEEDAILIIDVASGDQQKLTFGLDGIFSVDWSPRGDKLAFVGNTAHQSDIFVYDLNTQELTNLTDDIFSDAHPAWSPDGARCTSRPTAGRGCRGNRHARDMPSTTARRSVRRRCCHRAR